MASGTTTGIYNIYYFAGYLHTALCQRIRLWGTLFFFFSRSRHTVAASISHALPLTRFWRVRACRRTTFAVWKAHRGRVSAFSPVEVVWMTYANDSITAVYTSTATLQPLSHVPEINHLRGSTLAHIYFICYTRLYTCRRFGMNIVVGGLTIFSDKLAISQWRSAVLPSWTVTLVVPTWMMGSGVCVDGASVVVRSFTGGWTSTAIAGSDTSRCSSCSVTCESRKKKNLQSDIGNDKFLRRLPSRPVRDRVRVQYISYTYLFIYIFIACLERVRCNVNVLMVVVINSFAIWVYAYNMCLYVCACVCLCVCVSTEA